GRVRWWAHWTRRAEHGVLGILPERKRYLRHDPRLRMLLGLPPSDAALPRPHDKVLVVDATPIAAVRYPEELLRIGCVCLKAEARELALRLLEEDRDLRALVIERSVPGLDPAAFVRAVRERRPEAQIVGSGERLADEIEFVQAGVRRFLHRPWRVGDLL